MGVDRRRWTLGLAVTESCHAVCGAAVAAYGSGFEARAQVTAAARTRVPRATAALFRELAAGKRRRSAATAGVLASELADVEAVVVQQLIAREPAVREHALCVAVHDPGLWHGAYQGLCDAARLAELTGLNVIDALPARDLAQGGQGGPLLAAGLWMLLRHADRGRALVELGTTTRLTWLPAARDAAGVSRVLAGDVGPGRQLLNRVAAEFTPQRPLRAAQLAVQGCLRANLLDAWFVDAGQESAAGDWQPHGVPQRRLAEKIIAAVRRGEVTAPDALCTITCALARAVAARLAEFTAGGPAAAEIVLSGSGQQDGLLRQQLARLLPAAKFMSEREAGFPAQGIEPAAVALLAQLYLDQMPGNLPAVTGAQVPRVLGRLTPGMPSNWLRLVREMARHQPVVTLRTAM